MFKILSNGEQDDATEVNNKTRRFKPEYLINRTEKKEKWHRTLMNSKLKNSYSEI